MSKLLIWLLILFFGWYLTKHWLKQKIQKQIDALQREQAEQGQAGPNAQQGSAVVDTVACAHCGLHIDREQSVQRLGHTYCQHDHAKLGPKR